jgi:hypothetical protein
MEQKYDSDFLKINISTIKSNMLNNEIFYNHKSKNTKKLMKQKGGIFFGI